LRRTEGLSATTYSPPLSARPPRAPRGDRVELPVRLRSFAHDERSAVAFRRHFSRRARRFQQPTTWFLRLGGTRAVRNKFLDNRLRFCYSALPSFAGGPCSYRNCMGRAGGAATGFHRREPGTAVPGRVCPREQSLRRMSHGRTPLSGSHASAKARKKGGERTSRGRNRRAGRFAVPFASLFAVRQKRTAHQALRKRPAPSSIPPGRRAAGR
jgi:hypothetical protein